MNVVDYKPKEVVASYGKLTQTLVNLLLLGKCQIPHLCPLEPYLTTQFKKGEAVQGWV
jgi:hypothetical protein